MTGSAFAPRWWWRGLTAHERLAADTATEQPRWVVDTEQAVGAASAGPEPPPVYATWQDGYAEVVRPFVAWAATLAAGHPCARSLSDRLHADLVDLVARTLTLELHGRRTAGALGLAGGGERFADFVRHTARPGGIAALFERYPVLARLLSQSSRSAAEAFAETMTRLVADRAAIADHFFDGANPGEPVSVDLRCGDPHGGGRSVSVVEFAGGSRLVYKPRSLATCVGFGALSSWLNDRVPGLDLRSVRSLERDGYGWQEFVEPAPCADMAGVRRFYRRLGALLALLYAVHASDVHYGNLIACGDQPVAVDLETIFHPDVLRAELAADPAVRQFTASAHRTCVLPTFMVGDRGRLDISALGGDRGHVYPTDGVDWESPATDRMRLVRRPRTFDGGRNRPVVDGREPEPAEHVEDLVEGFRAGYDAITADRESFLATAERMDAATRVVLRPTEVYKTLLAESTHPDLLGDADARDKLFDLLWDASGDGSPQSRTIPHEIADLWRGDIPIFLAHPDSTTLTSSTGAQLREVLDTGARSCTTAKVRAMGPADRRTQEWVIRAALACRRPPVHRPVRGSPPHAPLAAARVIADEIGDRAAADGTRANWLGLEPTEHGLTLMPMGAALAYGYTGVALFLAQLAALDGDSRYEELARLAIRGIPQLFAATAGRPDLIREVGCGGYEGFGGIAYALARIANLTGDGEARMWAFHAVGMAATAAAADGPSGVADGYAGCLVAMMAVHAELDHAPAAALATRCAEKLAGVPGPPHAGAWVLRRYAAATRPSHSHPAATVGGPDSTPPGTAWDGLCVDTPGLMNGLAGAGYRLLRLACPDRVPSVLHLEPGPIAARTTRLATAN